METSWDGPISRDSYIVVCRNAYWLGLRPFDDNVNDHVCYKRLNFIVDDYLAKKDLRQVTGALAEGQYYIDFLTAYFILEKFRPKKTEKLIGLNDTKSIVEECIEVCEGYAEDFEKESQLNNYRYWIDTIKKHYDIK